MARKVNSVTPHSFSQLSPVEQYLSIYRFNERKKKYPTGILIHELFEGQAKRSPNAIAVTYLKKKITYQKLDQDSNRLANYLIKKGAKQKSFIAVSVDRSIEMITSLLAVLKIGAAYVPIEPSLPEELIKFMISDSSSDIVITTNKYLENFAKTKAKLLKIDSELDKIRNESTIKPNVNIKESGVLDVPYSDHLPVWVTVENV